MLQKLLEALARARRLNKPLAVFLLGLVGFKSVGDRHGHAAADVAAKLPVALAKPFALQAGTVTLGGSIGIAMHEPDSGEAAEVLPGRADEAMYDARNCGRNRHSLV